MTKMINYGIDLGTTNSLIAKFNQGTVEVYKNPNGFKETLPSVVGFRNDRILVGDPARAFSEKDPLGVASQFKRKMGTTETIKIQSVGTKSPIELSAYVLKELKNFVQTGEQVDSAVITIPASFDTVQSNATKEAGIKAGFKNVILLQEPIAASLAFANKEKDLDLINSQWIVYDLGGGTFDVAVVRIVEGELTVIDHEGDNYLGGADFDALIVEKILVPEILKLGTFTDLLSEMKSSGGKYNRQWHGLLRHAESAKIELSAKSFTEIDLGLVSLKDDNGNSIDTLINITRDEFESLIKPSIDTTIDMMKRILTRNSMQPSDLKFVLMVGGGTYVPFVRKRIEALMEIPTRTTIDPTNAIAIGAAYFAATKIDEAGKDENSENTGSKANIKVRASYNRNSQDLEEPFTAKLEGNITGLFYRIVSQDKSFDSGLRSVSSRIIEDLPLRKNEYNIFHFHILDGSNNIVATDFKVIEISQGRYNVAGQLVPEDISLVVDDVTKQDTRLLRVFPKNGILPMKSKMTREVAKTVSKGSSDGIRIMVVEGPSERHSSTNKPIGVLSITGNEINKDLIKGTEIDLTFELSDSRDLVVSAYVNGTGQQFSQVFKGAERLVDIPILTRDIIALENTIQAEIDEAETNDKRDMILKLEKLLKEIQPLITSCASMSTDDVTDDKFKIEDRKRKIAQDVYEVTSTKRLDNARREFEENKQQTAELVAENGNDKEKHLLREILQREQQIIGSNNIDRIESASNELERIKWQILIRLPDFLVAMFEELKDKRSMMNDQIGAKQLFDSGQRYIDIESWDDLRIVNSRLWDLLPSTEQEKDEFRLYTGIL